MFFLRGRRHLVRRGWEFSRDRQRNQPSVRFTAAYLSTPTMANQPWCALCSSHQAEKHTVWWQGMVLLKINVNGWERWSGFLPLNQERIQSSCVQGQVQSPVRKASSLQRYISSFSTLFLATPVGRTYFDSRAGNEVGATFSCPHSHTGHRSAFCHHFQNSVHLEFGLLVLAGGG